MLKSRAQAWQDNVLIEMEFCFVVAKLEERLRYRSDRCDDYQKGYFADKNLQGNIPDGFKKLFLQGRKNKMGEGGGGPK